MNCAVRHLGGIALVEASGRIDQTVSHAFNETLSAALAGAKTAMIIDLSGAEYLSSAGLRSLILSFRSAKAAGKAFAVAALSPLLKEVFDLSRFDQIVPPYDRVRDAIERLAPDALPEFDAH